MQQLDIKHQVSSMEHSQTKEQIEATNQIILKELKKKLGEAKAL